MTQQRYWHNATTLETYPMRLDIEPGQGRPLDSDGNPRDGFTLMPDGWEPPAPPPPAPAADWNGWRYESILHFEAVFAAVAAIPPGARAVFLTNMLMAAPNVNMDNMITAWNGAMLMIDVVPLGAAFEAINESAIAHHVPLRLSPAGVLSVA